MDTSTLPSTTDAYNALQSFNSTRPGATDYIDKANTQYNIPQDQQQVSGLQGAVNNLTQSLRGVAPSVQGRTAGTFTTAGQQSALINKEQAPIATSLTDTGTQLGQAQNTQGHDEQLASQIVQALLSQDNTKYQSLLDTYNSAQSAAQQAEAVKEFQASQALEQQKLAETKRQFDLTPRGGSGSDTAALIAALQGGKGGALDPVDQAAFDDVHNRITAANGNNSSLISDYAATKVSADRGNAGDKAKLQAYALAAPSLFGTGGTALPQVSTLVKNWGSPTSLLNIPGLQLSGSPTNSSNLTNKTFTLPNGSINFGG